MTVRKSGLATLARGLCLLFLVGCGDGADGQAGDAAVAPPERASENFIMPAQLCVDGECFWNANGGAVAEGQRFDDLGDCPTVRTQGIPWEYPLYPTDAEEPRLADEQFARELAWVTEQAEATACSCCHDSRTGSANVYDIAAGPSWVSAMTDRGLMMAAGIIDTDVLGAFAPEDNHGFDRYTTIFPTTNVDRFRQFFLDELDHRGVTEDEIETAEPLGGPLTENALDVAEPCAEGTGVDADGALHWPGGGIRYAWILEADAVNPGVPPNLDVPAGTLWHAAVHHDDDVLRPGELVYSTAPAGAAQVFPPAEQAPVVLLADSEYRLFLLRDHGQYLLKNCNFVYPIAAP
jgi:hypothetical protein